MVRAASGLLVFAMRTVVRMMLPLAHEIRREASGALRDRADREVCHLLDQGWRHLRHDHLRDRFGGLDLPDARMSPRLVTALAAALGAVAGCLVADAVERRRAEARTLTDDDMRKLARDA
jgi:hypothetical protein